MKKSIYLLAFICCILFVGCKKADDGTDSKEDLSYVIQTYYRYENNNHIYKNTWTYDGYKETGAKYYVDGQLTSERKNHLYNGLSASWDEYTYRDSVTDYQHVVCEYLDETFQRVKYRKTENYYQEPHTIREDYYEYDGKKIISYKSYANGMLTGENQYDYDGLTCAYTQTLYSSLYSSNVVYEKRYYNIVYLDDTYLRMKSRMRTTERYDINGVLSYSQTAYNVYDYDGKKPIGIKTFKNGQLSAIARDYQYDGLTCYYYSDTYRDGEVISTQLYEVEYLE